MSQSCASSSEMSSKVCGCGERLLLLKASTVKNKGDYFGDVEIGLPIHIVITLNGLMTRNSIFKGKKLKVKPVVEKELMVGKKVKKMKFL
ncbi:hypothetical protein DEO72_LG11g2673 [Vigna unguiculata]|uniref:Uncharacterized protein n=1 Tax=Vigna unguiculata TaxID=3917 RepID=A0A4D6NRV3_VIGUN|nr:hypothetical protein DEO72_LG11g2673 [Vigna unguiculata]